MAGKVDLGRSMLNAADEVANPYGLVLSEKERQSIYGDLNRVNFRVDAILNGKTGWKQQAEATVQAVLQVGLVCGVAYVLKNQFGVPYDFALAVGLMLIMLQRLNLALTSEKAFDTTARQEREAKKEAQERAQYLKRHGSEGSESGRVNRALSTFAKPTLPAIKF
jgi:hypothetical protein